MTTIAVTNQKGGVGKTTTAVNLGAELAAMGNRVLLVDLDPQGNASTALGIAQDARQNTILDVILGDATLSDVQMKTKDDRLRLVSATMDLASVEQEALRHFMRAGGLRHAIAEIDNLEQPEIVLIDCPPSLSLITIAALSAADLVIVPLQAEFLALEGLSQLMYTIQEVKVSLNPTLQLGGVLITMSDPRNRLAREVERDARQTLGSVVFQTVIPRNVRVSEAQSYGQPLAEYDAGSRAGLAYHHLAGEVYALIERTMGVAK